PVFARDRRGDFGIPAPEEDSVAAPREVDRERRPPGAGAQDRDLHGPPSRRSSPLASLFRFPRCLKRTRSAVAPAAVTTARGSPVTRRTSRTAAAPFATSRRATARASFFPCARRTFVAPAFPEPSARMSLPVVARTRRTANEIDPRM